MDELFSDQNYPMDQWLDSIDDNRSVENLDQTEGKYRPKTTTIEKVFDVSPIKSTNNSDFSYGSVMDFDDDLSFDKNKSVRKYFKSRRTPIDFSPTIGSTPKPQKTRIVKRKKKSYQKTQSDVSLWDKAITKNPELKQWINSFNKEMKKIESSELSVTNKSDNNTSLLN